jgi:hypothetical protein
MTMYDNDWLEETEPSPSMAYRKPARKRTTLGAIPLRVWFLVGLVALVGLAVVALWGVYLLRDRMPSGGPTPMPIIWTPTPAPTSPPTATPTDEPPPTVSPDIAIGVYVQVTGTQGVGLSMREGPGSNYARMDVALDGEVFIVVDGPRQAGEYDWWKIRDPDDAEREWWGAGNFLEPIEHP